jgi:hypothetical protein
MGLLNGLFLVLTQIQEQTISESISGFNRKNPLFPPCCVLSLSCVNRADCRKFTETGKSSRKKKHFLCGGGEKK